MCLNENIINFINQYLLIISIVLAFIYLFFYFKKKRRKKKIIRPFIVVVSLFIISYSIGNGVTYIKTCSPKETDNNNIITNPTTGTTTTTTTTKNTNLGDYIKTTPKGYQITYKDGGYYVDNYLLVNKTYALSSSFVPQNTYSKITDEICKTCIDKTAYEAFQNMKSDAAALGLNIYIQSGYRSYQYQEGLYQSYVRKDGIVAADTYSARAGHSEHQSGLSFDLNSITDAFAATNEGKWVNDNCYLYGFIIRYPKGKTDETGFKYESWHLRYVGKDLAKTLYNDGNWLTMENYFGVESKYQ